MPRRKIEGRNDVMVIFRTNAELKARMDAEADKLHTTTADWLRSIVIEKLDGKSDDELERKIRAVFAEITAEKNNE